MSRRCVTFGVLILALLNAACWPAQGQPTYDLTRLGLLDAEHADPLSGRQYSWVDYGGSSELLVGISLQLGVGPNGRSAWCAEPGTQRTIRLGFLDAEHTAANGERSSSLVVQAYRVPNGGELFGESFRYAGSARRGQSAWRYSVFSGATVRAGFTDDEHTGDGSGDRSSAVTLRNTRGDAAGVSTRYEGAVGSGRSAWFLGSASLQPVRIGLFDAAHTSPVGAPRRWSTPRFIAPDGCVAGVSDLYHTATLGPGASLAL